MERELEVGLGLVALAAQIGRQVQSAMTVGRWDKDDRSPVTVADLAIQAVISAGLEQAFPQIPLMGEEGTDELSRPENAPLVTEIVQQVSSAWQPQADRNPLLNPTEQVTAENVLRWIGRGHKGVDLKGRYWVLDPVDGTKGFLRKEQYAIALALIENGRILLGILGCPNLPGKMKDAMGSVADGSQSTGQPTGLAYVAIAGQGARAIPLTTEPDLSASTTVAVSSIADPSQLTWVERVESSSSNKDRTARIAELAGIVQAPIRLDSQAKYAVVARGESALYLRHTTDPNYRECVWDHAAGVIVIEEAGGKVTDLYGQPLNFSLGRHLTSNRGIIATNGLIHDRVLAAVGEVLGDNR